MGSAMTGETVNDREKLSQSSSNLVVQVENVHYAAMPDARDGRRRRAWWFGSSDANLPEAARRGYAIPLRPTGSPNTASQKPQDRRHQFDGERLSQPRLGVLRGCWPPVWPPSAPLTGHMVDEIHVATAPRRLSVSSARACSSAFW